MSLVIQKEIHDTVESQISLLIQQTKTYLPFIKTAFPLSNNLSNACYGLIAGYALSIFLNQYTIRMKYPSHEDFIEFGKIVSKYQDQIDSLFK